MLFRELFGKSPIKPLQKHMEMVKESIELLEDFFNAKFKNDVQKAEELSKKLFKLEHEADLLKEQIRDNLPSSFFMPINREDLLNLIKQQDNLIDLVEDLVIVNNLKEKIFPEEMKEDFFILFNKVKEVFKDCYELVNNLDELLAATFTGPEAEETKEKVLELEELEWETDKIEYKFSKKIFENEDKFTKGEFYLAIKTVLLLSEIADKSEKIAKVIRMFLVK